MERGEEKRERRKERDREEREGVDFASFVRIPAGAHIPDFCKKALSDRNVTLGVSWYWSSCAEYNIFRLTPWFLRTDNNGACSNLVAYGLVNVFYSPECSYSGRLRGTRPPVESQSHRLPFSYILNGNVECVDRVSGFFVF